MISSEENQMLNTAELFFKLSFQIATAIRFGLVPTIEYKVFTHGNFSLRSADFEISEVQLSAAPDILEHVATYLAAIQIDQFGQDRLKETSDLQVYSASNIARLIRNAFAHNPFSPTWITHRNNAKRFEIANIISLDATSLAECPVRQKDFGGPLAILALLRYVRDELLNNPLP